MALIKKPHELETTKSVKMLIYGQPGIGKTTLALSAPAPLLVDFDGGVHRVRPEHLTDTVQVSSWDDVIQLMSEDLSAYKTLVIDTAGKMLDFMSAYIIKGESKMGRKDGQLALQGYGVRKGMFQKFIAQAGMMGKHLVFVAHDKEERDGDTKIIRPEIGGSSSGDLIKELDLVGYMEAHGKNRTISFDPCEKFYGKNTCGLDSLLTLPDSTKVANTLLTSVFAKFAESLSARNDMMKTYLSLMESIRSHVDLVTGPEEANEFIVWAKTAPHLWDSSMQARVLITAKAKALGLVWNQKAGAYEARVAEVADAA